MGILALLEELDDIAVLGLAGTVERGMSGVIAQQRVGSAAEQNHHSARPARDAAIINGVAPDSRSGTSIAAP